MAEWRQLFGNKNGGDQAAEVRGHLLQCYDFPFGMEYFREVKLFTYLPFSPTFRGMNCKCPMGLHRCKGNDSIIGGKDEEL